MVQQPPGWKPMKCAVLLGTGFVIVRKKWIDAVDLVAVMMLKSHKKGVIRENSAC